MYEQFYYVVETPLEYPDRWKQLCVCIDLPSVVATLDILEKQSKPEEWPVRIQRIPVRR